MGAGWLKAPQTPAPSPTATPWPGFHPAKSGKPAVMPSTSGAPISTLNAADRTAQPIMAVADGSYGGAPLLNELPPGVLLLTPCAKHRALFALPPVAGTKGHPRTYGARLPTPTPPGFLSDSLDFGAGAGTDMRDVVGNGKEHVSSSSPRRSGP